MNWNHRVVRMRDGMLLIAEVFYNKDGTPAGYTECFLCSENIPSLEWTLKHMTSALAADIINEEDMRRLDEADDEEPTN